MNIIKHPLPERVLNALRDLDEMESLALQTAALARKRKRKLLLAHGIPLDTKVLVMREVER